jgi:hypothetical protein
MLQLAGVSRGMHEHMVRTARLLQVNWVASSRRAALTALAVLKTCVPNRCAPVGEFQKLRCGTFM